MFSPLVKKRQGWLLWLLALSCCYSTLIARCIGASLLSTSALMLRRNKTATMQAPAKFTPRHLWWPTGHTDVQQEPLNHHRQHYCYCCCTQEITPAAQRQLVMGDLLRALVNAMHFCRWLCFHFPVFLFVIIIIIVTDVLYSVIIVRYHRRP